MRLNRVILIAVVAMVVGAQEVRAQVGLEVRAGAAVGNHVPARAGLEFRPGPSVSVAADVRILSGTALYATYTRGSFDCEAGFCTGQKIRITDSGFGVGLRYSPVRLIWARAGILWHGADLQTNTGPVSTDPMVGYDLGIGAEVPILPIGSVVAGLGYRSHIGSDDRTTIVSTEVGLRFEL